MQYRRLGKTELKVSLISFGAIKLPQVDYAEAEACLNRALDLGVNFVDTARGYHDSEEKIGRALKTRRSEYYLATKSSARDAQGAMDDLETSLCNLGSDYVDLWQLHSVSDTNTYDQVLAVGGAYEAAVRAKQQGKARHLGVSIHRCHVTMNRAIPSGLFETLMVAYSPLDQEGLRAEILPLAQRFDLGVIVMKGLSGGALTLPRGEGDPPPSGGDPLVRGALRYIVSTPGVSTVIPGIMHVHEAEENCATADLPLPMSEQDRDALLRRIGSLRRGFRYGQVCLRCGYCQPCPEGVQIPTIFRAADMHRSYPEHLRHMGAELFRSIEVGPEHCTECGRCEQLCPAGLPIREKLKEAAHLFAAG